MEINRFNKHSDCAATRHFLTGCGLLLGMALSLGSYASEGTPAGRVIQQPVLSAQQMFSKGMQDRKQGNLQSAIRSFQGVLSNNPELQRARLELAVAYYQAMLFAEAKKQARVVLNDPATPAAVKRNVRAFLAQVEKAGTRHTFRPYIRAGFMHDSNVNVGPDDSVIAGVPTTNTLAKREDHALLVQFGALHRLMTERSVNLGKNQYALIWISKFNVYRTDYNEVNERDLDVISVSSGPAVISAKRWRAALNFQSDYVRLGDQKYAVINGLNPNIILIRDNQKTEWTLDFHWQSRDYKQTADNGQDSDFYAFGLSYGHVLKNSKLSYQMGLRVFDEQASSSTFSNSGSEWFAGINYQLKPNANWYFRASRKYVEYDGLETGFTLPRDEQLDRFVLGYQHTFSNSALDGWELKAHWTHTRNDSNLVEFEYDRNQFAITIGKRF